MGIDKAIEKTPGWLWAVIVLGFLSIAGFGVLFFGYAGVGTIRITVATMGGDEEVKCTVELSYREISKATDHAKGCLKWQTGNCAISFGSMCESHAIELPKNE